MKISRTLSAALCSVALLAFTTACGDTETEWVTAPTISASEVGVNAPDSGGTLTLGFTVSNPVKDGTVTASPSSSWITVTSCTETSVALTVNENPNGEPRTARVTVTYSYTLAGSKGSCSCEITVAQSCGDQPVLSVQSTAVVAAIEGGTYSFDYTIVNPASNGEISASTSATWISAFNTSKDGEVSFSVAENTGTLRQDTIELTYSWDGGSTSESVTVVQDHKGGSGDDSGIEGTYTLTGISYESYPNSSSWTMTIHYAPNSEYTDSENPYLIDGLTYREVGDYPDYLEYCAKARVEGNNIVIPAQITHGPYWIDETTTAYNGYVAGYIDSSGSLTAYDGYPDIVFTYNAASESWSCNYGIMGFLYSSLDDFSTFTKYFSDFTVGDITLVKNGGSSGGNYGDMTGTYSASGFGIINNTTSSDAEWNLYITAKSDTEYYVYCLTPFAGGLDLSTAGANYWAVGHWGSETTFVIPSQVCAGQVTSSDNTRYYLGYTPCVEYDENSGYYYSQNFPPLTFTKTGDDKWESDYGVFVGGFTTQSVSSLATYLGVVAPSISITKTSSTVPSALSDTGGNSVRRLDAIEVRSDLKATRDSVSNSHVRMLRAETRAER